MRTVVLSTTEIHEAEQALNELSGALGAIYDLQDKLVRREDRDRARKLYTAVNRLEDAQRIVESCFS